MSTFKVFTPEAPAGQGYITVEADRFILSSEQGAYLFLNTTSNEKEAVAIFSYGRVTGVSKVED